MEKRSTSLVYERKRTISGSFHCPIERNARLPRWAASADKSEVPAWRRTESFSTSRGKNRSATSGLLILSQALSDHFEICYFCSSRTISILCRECDSPAILKESTETMLRRRFSDRRRCVF